MEGSLEKIFLNSYLKSCFINHNIRKQIINADNLCNGGRWKNIAWWSKTDHNSPISSLFLISRAMFRRAVATAHTTLSLSILSSSTRIGRPFSLRTAARMYTDHFREENNKRKVKNLSQKMDTVGHRCCRFNDWF